MAKLFAKIAKGLLYAGGSIISILGLPMVGAPLLVAGTQIDTSTSGTVDNVAAYGNNFATALNAASAMQAGMKQPSLTMGLDTVIQFIKANLGIILLLIAGIFVLPRIFSGRRR